MAPPMIYTLSLHDALPISDRRGQPALSSDAVLRAHQRIGDGHRQGADRHADELQDGEIAVGGPDDLPRDRKSTRLNSSHMSISYAVFCLKKKKKTQHLADI